MEVKLIQRPTEVQLGRKTILADGHHVGYYHGAGKPLIMILNMRKTVAQEIKAEVEKQEGVTLPDKIAIPPPTPPEWLVGEEEEEE